MGTDTLGHAVYIIGFGSGARECSQAMESVLGIMGWAGGGFSGGRSGLHWCDRPAWGHALPEIGLGKPGPSFGGVGGCFVR